ncbi:MAG: ribbon-helix-helix protein, CopG family [Myxococcales bacterium]|nr:ribbon-helix-helix protein, CopG family [Myxococcales bacterium]
MAPQFEIDLDREKIRYDNEWLGREELAVRIKRMIDQQDFRLGGVGQALEALQAALSSARTLSVKFSPEELERLEQHARSAGVSGPALVRQAVQAYLAAQAAPVSLPPPRPLPIPPPVLTAITTEPVKPGEEGAAIPLTGKKNAEPASVVVDPSLRTPPAPPAPPLDDTWFKKV